MNPPTNLAHSKILPPSPALSPCGSPMILIDSPISVFTERKNLDTSLCRTIKDIRGVQTCQWSPCVEDDRGGGGESLDSACLPMPSVLLPPFNQFFHQLLSHPLTHPQSPEQWRHHGLPLQLCWAPSSTKDLQMWHYGSCLFKSPCENSISQDAVHPSPSWTHKCNSLERKAVRLCCWHCCGNRGSSISATVENKETKVLILNTTPWLFRRGSLEL